MKVREFIAKALQSGINLDDEFIIRPMYDNGVDFEVEDIEQDTGPDGELIAIVRINAETLSGV